MRNLNRRSKITLAIAAAAFVTVNAGAAYAYWKLSGTASGSAAAATIDGLSVSGSIDPAKPLYPGGTGALLLTIANNNDFPVIVNGLARHNLPISIDVAHANKGCAPTTVELTDTLFSGNWPVPKGQTATFPVPAAIKMAANAPITCAGATYSIPIKVVGVTGTEA